MLRLYQFRRLRWQFDTVTKLLVLNVLPTLVSLATNDPDAKVRRKSIYAISSAIRNFQPNMNEVLIHLPAEYKTSDHVDAGDMDAIDTILDKLRGGPVWAIIVSFWTHEAPQLNPPRIFVCFFLSRHDIAKTPFRYMDWMVDSELDINASICPAHRSISISMQPIRAIRMIRAHCGNEIERRFDANRL